MAAPLDIENIRETKEKRTSFTVPANSKKTIFYEDNEDGWVNEVFIYCTGDLTLEIYFGSNQESMKISDAYAYGLTSPSTTFWVPVYNSSSSLYAIGFKGPHPYKGSIHVTLNNTTAADITVTRVIFRRIVRPAVTK